MLTEQQQALIEAVATRTSSTIGRACAGTGKTFTAVEAVKANPEPTYFVAFNKRVAEELKSKMPLHADCMTLNGAGHRAWMKKVGKLTLEKSKTFDILKQMGVDFEARGEVKDLVSRSKAVGIVPQGSVGGEVGPVEDTSTNWQDLADSLDIAYTHIEAARECARRSIHQAWKGIIDFDDQLLLPAVYGAPVQKRPLIGVDEAQDLSPIQHKLLRLFTSERIFAVGDPHQSIYGFRGAMNDSMSVLASQWAAEWLNLTVSFRCPKAVTNEAKRYVPDMESHPDAPEGIVTTHDSIKLEALAGGTIVCRYNKPLLQLAFGLINAGIGASILGKDLAKGLERLLKRVGGETIDEAKHNLRAHLDRERQKLDERGASTEVLEDKISCLFVILNNCKTLDDAFIRLQTLFTDQVQPMTMLTSIHKAKGLEWDRVYFLDPQGIPSRWATQDWELQQEYNCAYVAITRAKKELHYIRMEGIQ